ncbi:Methyltransferase domain-containing protein [Geoalkalibacter ferrihydriticus]|uniref:Methyltransferase domain-containing protein n=1 Tax=Geoalkalibacter ferrihydriticus TaxID=392333 RepID=A0A1G9WLC4_9BACT|nr:class I SAM-dependent methyltransferase [Geoalkalibacter ferrihydriticus]SDM84835.1 Methyltransferase domain-containing protein [Geoalkalibacter ferrihydriticus]
MASSEDQQKKKSEAEHFDKMVSGGSKEVVFYDTDFVSKLAKDIVRFAIDKVGNVDGKKVLLYGSGVNLGPAIDFVNAGATVVMIDISPKSVETLNKIIQSRNLGEKISAIVMDCENLEFEDGSFDFVFGRAILHHLDVEKSLKEIQRILKKGGRSVFIEPLGMNPLINLFRYLTPSRRTPDEKPFNRKEFDLFQRMNFEKIEHFEFSLVTNVGIFCEAVLKWKLFKYETLKRIDDVLLSKVRFFRRFCWNTVLVFER